MATLYTPAADAPSIAALWWAVFFALDSERLIASCVTCRRGDGDGIDHWNCHAYPRFAPTSKG